MEISQILQEQKTEIKKEDTETSNNVSNQHAKPVQLRDIENRSVNNNGKLNQSDSNLKIKELIEKEREECYLKPWNKLDKGMRLNRLKLFIQEYSEKESLTENKKKKLSHLLLTACHNSKLTKNTEVEYDTNSGIIISIKTLKTDSTNFHLENTTSKKVKHTSKSRSNIDRFISSRSK